MGNRFNSSRSARPSNKMVHGYSLPTPPNSAPKEAPEGPNSFERQQFTLNFKKTMASKHGLSKNYSKSKRPVASSKLSTTLPTTTPDFELNNDFEKDFEDAWQDLENASMDMDLDTEDRVSSRKFAPLKNSKPILQHDLNAKAIVQCSNCTMSCALTPSEVWIPSQRTPKVIAPESERTKSHLHIITCDDCSYGTCIACGLAPHLSECTFADTRVSLQALCSVDEAVTLLHKNYPGVATLHDARDMQHVLLESLTKIMATISGRATPTFGLAELLRKSTLLDIISELIRNTTVQSIELSPLLIQTWEFLCMIAERKELCGLLSEQRVEMKEKSWCLGELTFPLAFLPINQDFGMDLVNTPPREYSMWPLLQHCVDVAKQYLLENKDDIWSAAIIAKRIIDVHDMMKGRVPRVVLSPKKLHSTQLLTEYATGLHELFTAGITRKTQVNKSLNLGNYLTERASAGSRQARAGFKKRRTDC